MLAPEVWNLIPPASSTLIKQCNSEEEIIKTIQNQYITHYVSLTLPNTLQLPQSLINVFTEDSQYYRINNISVAEFYQEDFCELFVEKGHLTAVSISCDLDRNDSFAFTPNGKLILSLNKKTFYELGINKKFFKIRNSFREYCISFDVLSDKKEFKKTWKQIFNKLKINQNLYFDVALAWEPNDEKICPSSIALYFSQKGYEIRTCNVEFKQRHDYNVAVPSLEEESDIPELVEWLGAFTLQCQMNANNYLSTLQCPEKNEHCGQVLFLTFKGLITIQRVFNAISQIKNYMKERSFSNWISLVLQGFEDGVVTTRNQQLIMNDGEKLHTVFFKLDHPTIVWSFHNKN